MIQASEAHEIATYVHNKRFKKEKEEKAIREVEYEKFIKNIIMIIESEINKAANDGRMDASIRLSTENMSIECIGYIHAKLYKTLQNAGYTVYIAKSDEVEHETNIDVNW